MQRIGAEEGESHEQYDVPFILAMEAVVPRRMLLNIKERVERASQPSSGESKTRGETATIV